MKNDDLIKKLSQTVENQNYIASSFSHQNTCQKRMMFRLAFSFHRQYIFDECLMNIYIVDS